MKTIKNFRRVSYSTKEGIYIWYLLSCEKQNEQKILSQCQKYLSGRGLKDAFILTYDCLRRYEGAWHMEKKRLFPNNVVLESDDGQRLLDECESYNDIIQQNSLRCMSGEEEGVLKLLCGKTHNVEMSRGIICRGITKVMEGPLKGMEDRIQKIDRHKRLAWIHVQSEYFILAGLEIVEKG